MKPRFKVAIISKADASGGGASRVADDLCRLLRQDGHTVGRWLGYEAEPCTATRKLYGVRTAPVLSFVNALQRKAGAPELLPLEWPALLPTLLRERYDILHFHDLTSFISPLTLGLASRFMPTVWTFHDCSPFTGGCINPLGCRRFHTRCHDCPQFGTPEMPSFFDLSGPRQDLMRRIHARGTIQAVVPSRWMAEQARLSGMLKRSPILIHNSVDLETFVPRDRKRLRRELGLPEAGPILMLTAAGISLRNPFKGFDAALKVIRGLRDLSPFILMAGGADEEFLREVRDFHYLSTGFIDDPRTLARYYAAADCFLNCTMADNLPLVVLEVMACGTPMVGFATGGIPDMVEPGATGLLVETGDTDGLQRALRGALTAGTLPEMGRAARAAAEARFSQQAFLERHLDAYRRELQFRDKRSG